ncbi:MAG: serine/threonine-protein phosphatase 6 regulatory ankyrin repeat subunit B-like isoform [Pedosphaera sp.]|nr:serine/threonine-protein phosphatase 6 regulatory ankyrin repeat subunit B-like isoform [Pedosphaera sp.]
MKILPKRLTKAEKAQLIGALEKQQASVVRKFIGSGWNPSELIGGENPLNFCDTTSFVKLLIGAGANVNSGQDNWTPLLLNCDLGKKDIVALLIKHGADVNRAYSKRHDPQIPFETTPLMKAAGHDYLEVVKLLLGAGAQINAVDEHGHNALFRALYSDMPSVAKELIRCGGKLSDDAIGGPVYHGNAELVKLLIKKKANVNCVFRAFEQKGLFITGETPLGCAVSKVGVFDYPV